MIELDEALQRLADSVELPPTSPQDDLTVGRARRRHRNLGAVGAAVTTAAVIGTSVVLLSGGTGDAGSSPGFAAHTTSSGGRSLTGRTQIRKEAREAVRQAEQDHQNLVSRLDGHDALAGVGLRGQQVNAALGGYRDILREDLDPAGARIQTGKITNVQAADDSLGTKLDWNDGGMLQIAVGRSLEGVQFFCDGGCTQRSVAGASKALVLTGNDTISVAVFQDDGDIVALTADTSFGNNGTSTRSLGLTVDQLLAAAADPRFDLPARSVQVPGDVGTQ
jgi:hypothetical protein